MRVYFAGPLFCQAEREFNLRLTEKIESMGYQVFLPQRDGVEANKPPYDAMPKEERRQCMFDLDVKEVRGSGIFLFVLDGRVPDEGACVELGIAFSEKVYGGVKHLLGLQTDQRAAFMGSKLNPMIRLALDCIASSEEELLQILDTLKVAE